MNHNTVIKITIPGQPPSKMRARTVICRKKVRTYDPQESDKLAYMWSLKSNYKSPPIKDPIAITLRFFIQPNHGDKNRLQKLWGFIPCTSKKDLDNMVKFILDCGNKIIYQDDSQITSIFCSQHWSEKPRTEIIIMKYDNNTLSKISDEEKTVLLAFSPAQFEYFAHLIYNMFRPDDFTSDFNSDNLSKDLDYQEKIAKICLFADEFYPIITKIHRLRAKRSHGK